MKPHVEAFLTPLRIPTAMLSVTRLQGTAPLSTLCSITIPHQVTPLAKARNF